MEETLRICRSQDILKDYLVEEEAANTMFTLLDEQRAKEFWAEELREEVREKEVETNLKRLMSKLNMTAEAAMDFMDIPKADQPRYALLLRESSVKG